MATRALERAPARVFYRRMATGLALFIILAFAQFAARGYVDYAHVPVIVHLHAAAMTGWLALFVVQAHLPSRGAAGLHRTLGWASVVMVPAIVALAITLCLTALSLGLTPPFFTKGFFLALVVVEALIFAALVGWAVGWRKRADWHRRLMLGSLAILLEPALGRLLPVPLLGGYAAEWLAMAIQLLVPTAMLVNDRRDRASVHPATLATAVAIIASHAIVATLAAIPQWQAFANHLAG